MRVGVRTGNRTNPLNAVSRSVGFMSTLKLGENNYD